MPFSNINTSNLKNNINNNNKDNNNNMTKFLSAYKQNNTIQDAH